jgi:hypothetical protein
MTMSWIYYDDETGAYSYPDDEPESPESDDPFPEGDESGDEGDDFDGEPVGPDDLSDDGEALASVGWGTDEDYGYDGGDEY